MGCDMKQQKQITTLLVTVVFAFVFLHLPQLTPKIYESIYSDTALLFPQDPQKYITIYSFTALGYQITDFQNSNN